MGEPVGLRSVAPKDNGVRARAIKFNTNEFKGKRIPIFAEKMARGKHRQQGDVCPPEFKGRQAQHNTRRRRNGGKGAQRRENKHRPHIETRAKRRARRRNGRWRRRIKRRGRKSQGNKETVAEKASEEEEKKKKKKKKKKEEEDKREQEISGGEDSDEDDESEDEEGQRNQGGQPKGMRLERQQLVASLAAIARAAGAATPMKTATVARAVAAQRPCPHHLNGGGGTRANYAPLNMENEEIVCKCGTTGHCKKGAHCDYMH